MLFSFDAETVHNRMLRLLRLASRTDLIKNFIQKNLFIDDPRLHCSLGNVKLANPIGLAAGFDKNLAAPLAYSMCGFGFAELGSVTKFPCAGNSKPRLWRLPEDQSLIVNYGLANQGAQEAEKQLVAATGHSLKLGVSIAAHPETVQQNLINEYLSLFARFHRLADYITLNISCPNVLKYEIREQISFIRELLKNISIQRSSDKDLFLKISPILKEEELAEITDLCLEYQLTGIIAANLIKNRQNIHLASTPKKSRHPGGLSGKPLQNLSDQIIKKIYQRAGEKLKIIGVGGVFTAADAYQKILYGASAVQLITGWIYGGPLTIKKINNDLLNLLKKDGFKNIGEAVGKEAR